MAWRVRLGAGQAGLVRLILLESALLAAAGCGLGLLLASAGVAASKGLLPADLPRLETVRVDWAVAGFAVLLAAVSALVSGLLPALHAGRTSVSATVRSGDRGSTRRHGSRSAFVVLEVGLSLTLLVGAVLMLRTFANLEARPLGFSPTRLLTFRLSLPWQTPDATSWASGTGS
ncbi:MAG: hypothetical protein JNK60_11860 [Acidobacteria bacterium]|nr:hypothetical protein [Acidobacteriota bacterium]